MSVNYGVSSPPARGFIWESKTTQDRQEYYEGERYQPSIQEGLQFVAAPYLPFDSSDFVKEFELYTVIKRLRLVSLDEQNFVVPANAIIKIDDGTNHYEGRPLVYSDADYGVGAYGDLAVDNPPVNLNPFTATAMVLADVNAEGVVSGASSTDPTAGGIAGRTFVGVSGQRFPIGALVDKVVSRSTDYTHSEFKVQQTLSILTHRTILVAELARNRYNYEQATRNAVAARNALVGAASALALSDVAIATLPLWAQTTGHDLMQAGDLVACDDAGEFIRFLAHTRNWIVQGTPGTPTDAELNGSMPVTAMNAVVGRCHKRERVIGDTGLNLVRTYKNSTAVGGSGTSGVEKVLTRGAAVTSTELSDYQTLVAAGPLDPYAEFDTVEGQKYGLLIHLNLL